MKRQNISIVQIMDNSVHFLTELSVEFRELAQKQTFSVGIVFAIINTNPRVWGRNKTYPY